MRRGEQPPRLPRELIRGRGRRPQRVDLLELPAEPLARASSAVPDGLPADLGLERVGDLGVRRARPASAGSRAGPRRGASAEQRAARQRRPAPGRARCARTAPAARAASGIPYCAKTRSSNGRRVERRAADDDDLLGGDPGAEQREHLGGDELGLGALAAGLEQADGLAGIDPRRRRLEQPPLEVVQSVARAGRVVLVERRQLEHALGQRPQLLDRLGAGGERGPLRLVGERHGHVGARRSARASRPRRARAPSGRRSRRRTPGRCPTDRAPPAARRARATRTVGVDAPDPLELAGVARYSEARSPA